MIVLKKGEGRTLKSGGSWIFDNEIDAARSGIEENGGITEVQDFDGFPMGKGYVNTNSKIRVRMLTRDPDTVIDRDFFKNRIKNAWEYRMKVSDPSCCRVIFSEADLLPGLVVDKFSDVLVVCFMTLGMEKLHDMITSLLLEVFSEYGINIKGIYERSDARVRKKEGLEPFKGFVTDPFDTNVQITENGVKYLVDVENGQKTGFFLDQKVNRKLIQKLSPGARVLDCFTHTGSFALNAAVSGAEKVTAVDASETAIEQAEKNAELNNVSDIVDFQCADVFDKLPELVEKQESYDLVILDPPAFTKSRSSVKNALRGYREINTLGMKLVEDKGFLATCTCSHFMTRELFEKAVRQAAAAAHVKLRQVSFSTQAPDHPILWNENESDYLKFYIFQVVRDR